MTSASSSLNPQEGHSANSILESLAKPPPPLELGLNKEENFRFFERKWKNYVLLSNFTARFSRDVQVAILENCLGTDAMRLYETMDISTDTTVEEIIDRFREACIAEKNITYERYCFNRRYQEEGETFSEFLGALRKLAKSCEFCNEKCIESQIKDRIVIGVRDATTQNDLLKMRSLSLRETIDVCRAAESAQHHKMTTSVDQVHNLQNKKHSREACRFCGGKHKFVKEECPAWGKTCKRCGKKNHFSKCCRNRSKIVNKIQIDHEGHESSEGDEWVNVVNYKDKGCRKDVKCRMTIRGKPITFQIDTGASVNIIPQSYSEHLQDYHGSLKMWDGTIFHPKGVCRRSVKNPRNNKTYNMEFVVCEDNCQAILGLKASQAMGLVTIEENDFERVDKIEVDPNHTPHGMPTTKAFDGSIGKFDNIKKLQVRQGAIPRIMPQRRVPIAMRNKLKTELDRLTTMGIIEPVVKPTPWVSQLVIAQKKSGDLRICIDPHELNKVIERERYQIPTMEDMMFEMKRSKVFSKVDLSSGYWHVPLDEDSSLLTTFQTCFGRYKWKRLPFGLSVSAEIFQKELLDSIYGLEGVVCVADDVVIHGETEDAHDKHFKAFLQRCDERNIKLNKKKLEYKKSSVTFMGHVITKNGIAIDPEKVKSINALPAPQNVEGLRRFLGMVNFVGCYIPNLSKLSQPLNDLLRKEVQWTWSSSQETSFQSIKQKLSEAPVLRIYNPDTPLTIENDASDYGLGSVLLQENRPVAYASRSLSEAEKRYAQIEKEMLAVTFGLERFHHYTYGRKSIVVTDHKPLEAIHKKPLSKAPRRLQKMLIRAATYDIDIVFRPGKEIPMADTLSRNPLPNIGSSESDLFEVHAISISTAVKSSRLREIQLATQNDDLLQELANIIKKGWPDNRRSVSQHNGRYFDIRDEMAVHDGIVYRGDRIVIPHTMRKEMLFKVHSGHLGVNSCLRRAREQIYWPGMSSAIRTYIQSCNTCAMYAPNQSRESMMIVETPLRPWETIATDIFTWAGKDYLVTTDYLSGFFEIDPLMSDSTSNGVIAALKPHFARYGLPNRVISDNGPQFISKAFKDFAREFDFQHTTSSPGHSEGNGAAEAAVKIAKNLLRKTNNGEDLYIALLSYRNTPTEGLTTSPAQRLMGRRTRTTLPQTEKLLEPAVSLHHESHEKTKRKCMYAEKKGGKDLKVLNPGDHVMIYPTRGFTKKSEPGIIRTRLTPRSYEVEVRNKILRRNRRHIRHLPYEPPVEPASSWIPRRTSELMGGKSGSNSDEPSDTCEDDSSNVCTNAAASSGKEESITATNGQSAPATRTRSGRLVKRIDRLNL